MNLLFDCHTFDVGPQGTTTFLAGLLNALPGAARVRGVPISVTCAAKDEVNVARFVEAPYSFEPMQGGFAARNMKSLPKLSRQPGLGAVVSQYVRPFRSRVPTVSVIHDVLFLDFPHLFGWRYRVLRQLLFGWSARHSDVVITVSDYSRDRIAHHFGIPAERIDVLPNAVDFAMPLPIAASARASGAPLRLLYVSRFETRKRQHWCVAVANALAARGQPVELTLVGHAEGPYADTVRSQIATEQAPGATIAIRSNVPQVELQAMFASTDLFLFPSECEGFGIPVIEAAACGIPCVVAANTALAELEPYYAGIAVTGNEVSGFIEAVSSAASQLPTLRQQAIARAPLTRDAFKWSDVAEGFLATLARRRVLS